MTKPRAARDAHPAQELEALARELAGGKPLAQSYLVRGEERYFRENALRQLSEAATHAGLELARHDASDPDFSLRGLCEDLSSPALFAPARCVLVRGAAKLARKEKDAREETEFTVAALAFLRQKALAGTLVLDAEGLRADHVLAKALVEGGGRMLTLRRLWDSPPPWDPDPRKTELVLWLASRARERGIVLASDDAVFVVAATGNDLAALDAQLERIERRAGANLRAVVPWTSGGSPFQVAEQLLAGDAPRALLGLDTLFRGGFQAREGGRETDEGALLAILFAALRSKLSATVAAVQDPAALAAVGNPRAREELEARLTLRTERGWLALADELAALERRARQGAEIDVHELTRFALRARIERPARVPSRAARGGR